LIHVLCESSGNRGEAENEKVDLIREASTVALFVRRLRVRQYWITNFAVAIVPMLKSTWTR